MSRHGLPADARCPWCLRRFANRLAVDRHAEKKHRNNLARTPEDEARARLQHYHDDKRHKEKAR